MNKGFILLFVSLIALSSCGGKKGGPPNQNMPQPFGVLVVEPQTVEGFTDYPTNIQGINNNEVRAKIQGYIEKVFVDEGQFVSAGQPLFKLETNLLSQTANAAQSGVNAAQASIDAAQAGVNAAQVEVDKLQPLVAKNIISNVQLQTANANLERAKSQLGQARAAYAQARASYQGAVANVDYSIIRAPVSGVVGALPFKSGSLVGPSDPTPLTTVSDTRELYAYFSMNEAAYLNFLETSTGSTVSEKLKNMPKAELILANGSVFPEKGTVQTVTGQIDATTGTIQFRVAFPNKNGLLTNGNSGSIRIPKIYGSALAIPQSALLEQQGIYYVYKVSDKDTATQSVVKIEAMVKNRAIIKEGLQAGERIVADGVGNLKPKSAIKPHAVNLDSLVNSIQPIFE